MDNLIRKTYPAFLSAIFFTATVFGGFLFITQDVQAQYGSACSEYGPMAYESGGYCRCMSGYVMGEGLLGGSYCISADQSCKDQYGYNARANYAGNCECRSGYVFQDSYLGTQCVSADSVCHDKYGIMSRYDSLSGSCECSYGYVFGEDSIGRTQCISDDKACQNQLGYHSSASYGGQCECDSGYVIDGGQCVDGDQVCRADHGIYSSYNDYTNRCECDDDYTFDDFNKCVEKQHNVYFKLLDINPENDKELLIKSDYDSRMYIVRVGVGCLSTSISRYEGKNLVVNLGTDYEVDMFDTVVLQDHDQTCSIMHKERTYDDSFPELEEEIYYYTPPIQTYTPTTITPETSQDSEPTFDEAGNAISPGFEETVVDTDYTPEPEAQIYTDQSEATSTNPTVDTQTEIVEEKESFFTKIINFFKSWF